MKTLLFTIFFILFSINANASEEKNKKSTEELVQENMIYTNSYFKEDLKRQNYKVVFKCEDNYFNSEKEMKFELKDSKTGIDYCSLILYKKTKNEILEIVNDYKIKQTIADNLVSYSVAAILAPATGGLSLIAVSSLQLFSLFQYESLDPLLPIEIFINF